MGDPVAKLLETVHLRNPIPGVKTTGPKMGIEEAFEKVYDEPMRESSTDVPAPAWQIAALSPNWDAGHPEKVGAPPDYYIKRVREGLEKNEGTRRKLKETTLSDQAFAVAEIYRIVWEAAKPNLIFRDIVPIINTDRPIFRVIRAILIPRAFKIAEGAEIPAAGEKYDNVDVTVQKFGVRPQITREMVEDAVWDVIARQLAEAGRAVSQLENEQFLIGSASQAGLVQDAGNSVATATSGTLVYLDIVKAVRSLREQNFYYEGGVLVTYPRAEQDLLVDDKFIHAFYFGGLMKKALSPSEFFGQMLGFTTYVSTLIAPTGGGATDRTLLLDNARAGLLVIRRDLTVENLVDPIKDLTGMALTERLQYGTQRANAITKVTGGPAA